MRADDWLAARLAGAPAELGTAIRELVDARGVTGTSHACRVSEELAEAALAGFEQVLAETGTDRRSRMAALRLLAADAVLTYAFEAAAELGEDPWRLADQLGPTGALGERLAGSHGGPSESTIEGGGS